MQNWCKPTIILLVSTVFFVGCNREPTDPLARMAANVAKTEVPHDAEYVVLDSDDKDVQRCSMKISGESKPWELNFPVPASQFAIHARVEPMGSDGKWTAAGVWSDAKERTGKETLDEAAFRARLKDCVARATVVGTLEGLGGEVAAIGHGIRERWQHDIDTTKGNNTAGNAEAQ